MWLIMPRIRVSFRFVKPKSEAEAPSEFQKGVGSQYHEFIIDKSMSAPMLLGWLENSESSIPGPFITS
jgi:hypothetical protein